jgi:hypothetical protein
VNVGNNVKDGALGSILNLSTAVHRNVLNTCADVFII